MRYFLKKAAYIILYIPLLLVPHSQGVDFADKQRINKLPLSMAILVIILALGLVAGMVYVLQITL